MSVNPDSVPCGLACALANRRRAKTWTAQRSWMAKETARMLVFADER
jgi:hypothetical protein